MSLILKSIELSNIRSHKYITLDPSEDGVTAISGPNGSGKSTIVDSVAWTLYGTKPQGVSKVISILRTGADLTNEKAYSRVVLKLDHSELKVERRFVNKHGAVECEVWERPIGGQNWKQVAGPAVSHSEPYIRKKLKMDEKGFLAAILVQQKQVDQLISSGPRERAEVIERLTGIASITAALQEARQQYNGLKKALSVTSVDDDEVEALKKTNKEVEEQLGKITDRRDRAKTTLDTLEKDVRDLREQVAAEEKIEEELAELREELVKVTANIESLEGSLDRLTKLKASKKKQLASLGGGTTDIKVVEKKLNELKGSQRELQRRGDSLQRDIDNAEEKRKEYDSFISRSAIKSLPDAEEGLTKLETKLEETTTKLTSLADRRSGLTAETKKITSAVKVITSSDGTCPTCLQHVEDVDSAVESLESEKREHEEQIEKIRAEQEKLDESVPKLEKRVSNFQKVIESISKITEVTELIASLTEEKDSISNDLSVVDAELKKVEKVYNGARLTSDVKDEYDSLHKSALEISDSIETAKKLKGEIEKTLKTKEPKGGRSLATLRKNLASKNDKRTEAVEKYGELREKSSLLLVEKSHGEERIKNAEEVLKKYQELMEATEVAGVSVETIEEFRENRIKTSVPVVGAYASDLLNRFTEGKFTQLRLDSKFNATVTLSNGVQRSVGLLSGGELSAAALALRLAISMLLNQGSSTNMIILDEVLVSQDAARAEQILSTVKEVCRGQVLMISHGPYTNEIADKVVSL